MKPPSPLILLLAFASLTLPVFAGCLEPTDDTDATTPTASLVPVGTFHLQLVGEKQSLTTPGEKATEFWIQPHPSDRMRLAMGRLEFDPFTEVPPSTTDWRCIISTSTDGGHTWKDTTPVFPEGASDPWVAYEEDGTLHAVCNTGNYARSEDNGQTWEKTAVDQPGNDRPSILVDSRGRLFYCATRPGTNEGPSIAFSDDSGATWILTDASAQAPAWEQTICNRMAEGPDGTLYAAIGLSEFRILVSTDEGTTWVEKGRIPLEDPRRANYGAVVPTHEEGNMFPTLAVSPTSGALFVGAQNYSQTQNDGVGGYHIEIHRSQDHGKTFQQVTVPVAPSMCDRCDTTRASVHVDEQGRLALVWRTSEMSLPFQTWFSASLDEGNTWLTPVLLSTEDTTQGSWNPGSIDGADHYWAMTSTHDGFLAMWIDRTDEGRSAIWSQFVRVEAKPSLKYVKMPYLGMVKV